MFSTGLSSGAREGKRTGVMFSGMSSSPVVCQPARSIKRTAWESGATAREISFRWACMAWVLAYGMTNAAPRPLAGQMAPKRYVL